nr:tetratricopeptide repeat protein [Herpetosiphon sp.]
MALTTIQAVYDEARSALEAGKEERAINLSEYVLESFPNFLEAYRILGESHLNRQELEQAASAFQRVLRSDPENIPVHVGLGVTYERQGDLAGAIREFEQAFEIKPDLPELRTQLLRLYNEAWGKEHAHLRMKKVGLARMYVRGRNYTKAIQEFNDVLAHEPDRLDVQVALAEALWRNGEEQEAAELSREILARDPDVLKANLIAGYYALAQGDPKGKQLWQTAQRLDPTQGVAYALFDGMLPPVEAIDTKIESFNEEAWKAAKAEQQRREQAERDRIEREQQAAERAERERLEAEQRRIEAEQRQSVTTPAFAGGGSWLDEVETPSVDIAASDDFDDDDFLRQLLMGVDAAPPAPKVEPVVEQAQHAVEAPATAVDDFNLDDIGLDVTPFSLEDFDDQPKNTNQAVATPSAPVAQNPFATMHLTEPDMPQTSSNTSDEPDMTPFSLSDLGLDEDEIAQFQASETPTTPASTSDEPDMTPFSLSDLGLDDDEIAQFQASETPTTPASTSDEPDMT